MVNITHKSFSLRKAMACATVGVSSEQTITAIEQRKVPKGDVFEFARAAGLLAIKKTSDVIPDCHPLPVEYAAITYAIDGLSVIISVEVHTIYKTGVEVEAMHGAAVTALVIYDMLKPIDKEVTVRDIRLVSKSGGKTDRGAAISSGGELNGEKGSSERGSAGKTDAGSESGSGAERSMDRRSDSAGKLDADSGIVMDSKTGGDGGLNAGPEMNPGGGAKRDQDRTLQCAVIVCSDRIARGEKQDGSGKAIIAALERNQLECEAYRIIPDDFNAIQSTLREYVERGFDLVIFTGGTGLSPRDVTPDAVAPLIEKHIPGIMEVARSYGQQRSRYAMLSRGVAGFIQNTLVLTLPGSKKAAEETMEALFPQLLHVFEVRRGEGHL